MFLAWLRVASTISTFCTFCGYAPPTCNLGVKIGTPQFFAHFLGTFGVLPAGRVQLASTLSTEDILITLKLRREGARFLILWSHKFPWLLCKYSYLFPKDQLCLPRTIGRSCLNLATKTTITHSYIFPNIWVCLKTTLYLLLALWKSFKVVLKVTLWYYLAS